MFPTTLGYFTSQTTEMFNAVKPALTWFPRMHLDTLSNQNCPRARHQYSANEIERKWIPDWNCYRTEVLRLQPWTGAHWSSPSRGCGAADQAASQFRCSFLPPGCFTGRLPKAARSRSSCPCPLSDATPPPRPASSPQPRSTPTSRGWPRPCFTAAHSFGVTRKVKGTLTKLRSLCR